MVANRMLRETIALLDEEGQTQVAIAKRLGIHRETVRRHLKVIRSEEPKNQEPLNVSAFSFVDNPIDENRSAEELLDDLCKQFDRKERAEKSRKIIDVNIGIDGPVGVSFFGDPHLDNRGCNIPLLRKHVDLVKNTPGMYAGNVGDYTDNWVGRLAKLYADTTVTRTETLKLVEWLFTSVDWLFLIMGNHDHWNTEGGDVLRLIHRLGELEGAYVKHDLRLRLNFPNGNKAVIHARHDFKGHSQFNATHGLVKHTLWNYRDDILVCGDRHHSGYSQVWHNTGGYGHQSEEGILCHALRVGTYKFYDSFAEEKGFKNENYAPNMVAIINPDAEDPRDKILVTPSLEYGARYLTFLREEWARRKGL